MAFGLKGAAYGKYQIGRAKIDRKMRLREQWALAKKKKATPFAAPAEAKVERAEIKAAVNFEETAQKVHKLDENLMRLVGAVEIAIYNDIKGKVKEEEFLIKEKRAFAVMGRMMQDIKRIEEFNNDMKRWIELRKKIMTKQYVETLKGVTANVNDTHSVMEIGEKLKADEENIKNLIRQILQGLNFVLLVLIEAEKLSEETTRRTEESIDRAKIWLKQAEVILRQAAIYAGMQTKAA
jgi:hypothetical protein